MTPARAQERSVDIDGLRIHVRTVGDGPPVLLINGLGANTGVWVTLERTLEEFRLIEFDAPGTGRSSMPLRPMSIRRLARVATGVLDEVGVGRADVLGYSLGGIVAQQLAVDAPERVRRLVLVCTTVGMGGISGTPLSLLNVAIPIRYLSEGLYSRSLGGLTGGRARRDRDWARALSEDRLVLRPSLRGYLGQTLSVAAWNGLPILERIEQPTLVVGGDDDPLAPIANAMLLANRIPRARLLAAPGEGHLIPVDADSAAQRPIRDFLAAPSLERSRVWRRAAVVGEDDLRVAVGSTRQSQPLGALAALVRRRWPSPPAPGSGAPGAADAEPDPQAPKRLGSIVSGLS